MPFGTIKPICFRCNSTDSSIWRKVQNEHSNKEEIICNDCSIELKKTRVYLNEKTNLLLNKDDNQEKETTNSETGSTSSKMKSNSDLKDQEQTNQPKMLTRKSTRNKRGSNRLNQNNRNLKDSKGKSRRNIFKRNVSVCYRRRKHFLRL